MAQTVCVLLDITDAARLAAIASDRSRPLKHIQRARIVLLSAERLSVQDVARRAGVSRPAVWRWQRRYGEAGVEGLLHENLRLVVVASAKLPAGAVHVLDHDGCLRAGAAGRKPAAGRRSGCPDRRHRSSPPQAGVTLISGAGQGTCSSSGRCRWAPASSSTRLAVRQRRHACRHRLLETTPSASTA
ncbi:helix-turn-helix domain-containing protein [Methylobacterium soli]|uniref:Helix-turn-helix domain-containing protein n=1 Tax=Methylobacterium soli TaxID=553447 RepID=A0A6L3SUF8_9HYPH|nr:helix-turn-helix domain-containing protein [Methylobacterium soli]